jgi:adhesin/invasin
MTRLRHLPAAALAGLAVALAALAGGAGPAAADGACPSSNPPNMLKVAGGSPQTAQLGRPFDAALRVALANSNGCPLTGALGGVAVQFAAPSSGASGSFSASGSNVVTVGTDDQGVAVAPTFTANDAAGNYIVSASSYFGSVGLYLANTAAGVASGITVIGGGEQQAALGSQYGQPLRARVVDPNGNPVAGVTVSFSIATGAYGASASFLSGGAQATAVTDGGGQATSPPLLANGSPGRFTATASATGIAIVATFALANHAAANTLTASTAPRAATVATSYRQPLSARLLDPSGQPIEGATVTFALAKAANGASATFPDGSGQATATTDASGRADSPPILANGVAGRFAASATVSANPTPVSYPLRNLAGPPSAIAAGAASGQSARTGARFPIPLAVTVSDADENPVPGALVSFRAPARGPSARFGGRRPTRTVRVRTNAHGVAVAPRLRANATAGGYVVVATVAGTRRLRTAFALVNRT